MTEEKSQIVIKPIDRFGKDTYFKRRVLIKGNKAFEILPKKLQCATRTFTFNGDRWVFDD